MSTTTTARTHRTAWSRLAPALVAIGALAFVPPALIAPAQAATVQDCTRFGTTAIDGGAYIYQQNEWNSDTRQCVSVDDASGAWTIDSADLSNATNGAPGTYPSIFKGCHWGTCTRDSGMPIRVSDIGAATTSWSTTLVDSGAYDVAYDLWFNSTPTTEGQPDGTEMMIWLNSRGGVQPFGSKVTNATVAGKQWDVWIGDQAAWKIISYVLTPPSDSVQNLDTKALIDDAVRRGAIDPQHYLLDVEAGFEVWNGGTGLTSNHFSFSVSPVGATTGPPTPPPPTTTPPPPPSTPPPPSPSTTPPAAVPVGSGCTASLGAQGRRTTGGVQAATCTAT